MLMKSPTTFELPDRLGLFTQINLLRIDYSVGLQLGARLFHHLEEPAREFMYAIGLTAG